jgi:hypothetical protein
MGWETIGNLIQLLIWEEPGVAHADIGQALIQPGAPSTIGQAGVDRRIDWQACICRVTWKKWEMSISGGLAIGRLAYCVKQNAEINYRKVAVKKKAR